MKVSLEPATYESDATAGRRSSLGERVRHLLTGSMARRAVVSNSGWLLFDKLLRAMLGLVVGAWVARYLGPIDFGTLAYIAAFVAMFMPFANLSADAILVRRIAQTPDSAPALLGTALLLRTLLGLICWLLAVLLAYLLDEGDTYILTAIVGGVLLFQSADVVDLWFQSQAQSRRSVLAKLVAFIGSSSCKVGLILAGAPLILFAAIIALEALASAAALCVAYRTLCTHSPWHHVRSVAQGLLYEAWPFMLSGFAIMVYMRLDQIMIKKMLGAESLGVYAVALPISQFWQVIPLALASSVAPFIARQKLLDEAVYRRSIVLISRAFFYFGVIGAGVTFVVSDWLVSKLFGPAYAEAARLLDLHVISNVFCFLGIAHGLWLVNERRFAVRLWGTGLAGLTTVAVNYFLLPVWGVAGACVAAIAAQASAAFLINALLDRQSFRLQIEAITFWKVAA